MNTKQQAFVEAYLQSWNATDAARVAGYTHPNKQGPRLLVNVGIKTAIKDRLDEMKLGADEVLIRLGQQARFDPLKFVTITAGENGDRVSIDLAAIRKAGLGAVVKKIYYDRNGMLTVEFHDSQGALRLIGQNHQLFARKHIVETPDLEPLPEVLRQLIGKVYGDAANKPE